MSAGRDAADEADEHEDAAMGLATEVEVVCPYCGESVTLALDPAGGVVQEYIEDCQVCCRPWRLHVNYRGAGVPEVSVERAE